MNPMTNVKNIKKLSEQDLKLGGKSSWHDQYKDSAWIFIGGLPYDLTEGDIICVFSQYGEVVHINLVRDKDSGKQKGFCFLCYEDQRSTILAVDNLNGIKLLGRTLRVDHVENYKAPQESKKNPIDDETRILREEGCGPSSRAIQPSSSVETKPNPTDLVVGGVRLPPRLPIGSVKVERSENSPARSTHRTIKVENSDGLPPRLPIQNIKSESSEERRRDKKTKLTEKSTSNKKSKEERKSKKKKRRYSSSSSSSTSSSGDDSRDSSQSSNSDKHKKKRRH